IGLEIHAELNTESKMFCSCKNDPEEKEANINICPICLGHPGTLPAANENAIHKVIKTGLAVNGNIAEKSKFDRKNYFYPDLPKGYQISQYDMPIVEGGKLNGVAITRIHLEEDTGSSMHPANTDYSLVNFNRAGVPLMELVTEPVITTVQQAKEFAQQFQLILQYIGVSQANMEKGQMRVEVNISIRSEKQKKLGTKVEVKNINSFRAVGKTIEYEIERQTKILEAGDSIAQETRGWDENKQETFSQREKEEAHDYRYFPEPDLPPLSFSKELIEEIQHELPELPQARKKRFKEEYKLSDEHIEVLVGNKDLGEYFEQIASELGSEYVTLSANYLVSDLRGMLKGMSVEDEEFKITAENFAELIELIGKKEISTPAAKAVLYDMFETGADPNHIVGEKGLTQVSDKSQIETIAKEIIKNNQKAVGDYKKGKEQALKFLVGQLMAQTKGAVDPETANQVLKSLLNSK
ncbi:Asp-tRNA(Asn)/Glu-tRNA(Gln) amidotransferase subunit GatB, partial [Patescibacteria group bacterium]|nr:Asp-tRNA(Asn)/Glu-tRNA(Gln) amidotransferase subunit GatB [Patescibacteria group bacterium]